jgi:hypothetical protein
MCSRTPERSILKELRIHRDGPDADAFRKQKEQQS